MTMPSSQPWKYNCCKYVGHLSHDCNAQKANECRYKHNQWRKHVHLQHNIYLAQKISEVKKRGQDETVGSRVARCISKIATQGQDQRAEWYLAAAVHRTHIRVTTSNVRVCRLLQRMLQQMRRCTGYLDLRINQSLHVNVCSVDTTL